jgi:hypothetical protein
VTDGPLLGMAPYSGYNPYVSSHCSVKGEESAWRYKYLSILPHPISFLFLSLHSTSKPTFTVQTSSRFLPSHSNFISLIFVAGRPFQLYLLSFTKSFENIHTKRNHAILNRRPFVHCGRCCCHARTPRWYVPLESCPQLFTPILSLRLCRALRVSNCAALP